MAVERKKGPWIQGSGGPTQTNMSRTLEGQETSFGIRGTNKNPHI
jgi:hypothetical protein